MWGHNGSAYHVKAFMEIQPHVVKVPTMPNWVWLNLHLLHLPPRQDMASWSIKQRCSKKVKTVGSPVLEAPNAFDLYLKRLRQWRLFNLWKRQSSWIRQELGKTTQLATMGFSREQNAENYFCLTCNCQGLAMITDKDAGLVIKGSKGKPTNDGRESLADF